LVIRAAIESSSCFLLPNPAPLLEKERQAGMGALVANRFDPRALHRARTVAALAADDDPMNPPEIDRTKVLQQGLHREKPYGRRCIAQEIDTRQSMLSIFHADAP